MGVDIINYFPKKFGYYDEITVRIKKSGISILIEMKVASNGF